MRKLPGRPASHAVLLAAACGGLYALAQPDVGLWPGAFVCLVPLVLAVQGRPAGARAGLGWVAGTVAAVGVSLVPAASAVSLYFGTPLWLGTLAALGLGQVFGGLPFALLALAVGDPGRQRPALTALRCAAAVVAAEWLRSTVLSGLPWGLLGYALTPVPALAQGAALGGAPLLALLLGAANGGLARVLAAPRRLEPWVALGVATGLLAAPAALTPSGTDPRLPGASGSGRSDPPTLRVALVQGALPRASRRGIERVGPDLRHLLSLSPGEPVDVIVWSESALRVVLPENRELLARALRDAPPPARALLLGAPRSGPGPGPPYNAAILVDAKGRIRAAHDKIHLVPVAETIPAWLAPTGIGPSKNRPGEALAPLELGSAELGVLICYEVLFPELARHLVRSGAQILVNLSNDEWFAGRGGLEQHVAAAVLRAIETRRPVLRATNTGITAAIGPTGRVVARLPPDLPGTLVVEAPRPREVTLATRLGPWPRGLALVVLLLGGLLEKRLAI